ncbi:MAG: hypothetical protein WBA28_06260 [Microbacteriaceae bacterium]
MQTRSTVFLVIGALAVGLLGGSASSYLVMNAMLRSAVGQPGASGPDGRDGANGAAGATGEDGVDGADGQNGLNGARGATGQSGPQGVPGLIGPEGAAGADGTNGMNGLDGTNGQDGADGPQGVAGVPGLPGLQGPMGVSGTDGMDGAPGAIGPQGDPGIAGPQGEKGDPGIQGLQGIQGVQGVQGPIGATGAAGLVNFQVFGQTLSITVDVSTQIAEFAAVGPSLGTPLFDINGNAFTALTSGWYRVTYSANALPLTTHVETPGEISIWKKPLGPASFAVVGRTYLTASTLVAYAAQNVETRAFIRLDAGDQIRVALTSGQPGTTQFYQGMLLFEKLN